MAKPNQKTYWICTWKNANNNWKKEVKKIVACKTETPFSRVKALLSTNVTKKFCWLSGFYFILFFTLSDRKQSEIGLKAHYICIIIEIANRYNISKCHLRQLLVRVFLKIPVVTQMDEHQNIFSWLVSHITITEIPLYTWPVSAKGGWRPTNFQHETYSVFLLVS